MTTLGEVLVKAMAPPQSSPKQPLLRDTYTPLEPHSKLWTPAETDFPSPRRELEELYVRGRDLENSLYVRGRDFERSLASPPGFENSLKPLTIAEQFAQFGKAIQSIPEAPARFGAALREGIENLKVLGGAVVKGLEWLDRHFPAGPLDPYGRPVPRRNAQLYLLARRAYQGDYKARAIFLNEIGADRSPDNVLLVEPLLEPTSNPLRRDLRARWEQEPPEQARRKLRDLLKGHGKRDGAEEKERKRGEHTYEVIRHEANRQIRTPSELADVERHEDERLLYERLSITLPERQFMFCWLRGQGMKYAEIAAEMGVGISTVKTYAQLAKNNPNLREMLGQ